MPIRSVVSANRPAAGAAAVILLAGVWLSAACASRDSEPAVAALSGTERAVHLLNRATYGARPQDVEEVLRIGPEAWLERQLHPESIPEGGPEAPAAPAPAPTPAAAQAQAQAQAPAPAPAPAPGAAGQPADSATAAEAAMARMAAESGAEGAASPQSAGPQSASPQSAGPQSASPQSAQLSSASFPQALRLTREIRELEIRIRLSGLNVQAAQLGAGKLERALASERQLEAVMTDFWFNHFNVFQGKLLVRLALADYEENAIRRHVFGRFEDMLAATAHHPAMLMYLDNFLSSAPGGGAPGEAPEGGTDAPAVPETGGLNENYARELLELHTLGVDGGYTQQDVIEVARAFTGWTVFTGPNGQPAVTPGGGGPHFEFHLDRHDSGEKVVLGRTLPAGRGMEDGLEVLEMLARHPSTARHVATKLVRHFVADDPPPALVDQVAEVFRATDGDLREVTRALFTSEAFYDRAHYRAKVKRPFEFVVSALRVTGAEVQGAEDARAGLRVPAQGVLLALGPLNHVPYAEPAPTGYPTTAAEWVSAGALMARMTFALDLVEGGVAGVELDPWAALGAAAPSGALLLAGLRPDGEAGPVAADALPRTLLGQMLPGAATTHLEAVIAEDLAGRSAADPGGLLARAVALALGSPEFQRH